MVCPVMEDQDAGGGDYLLKELIVKSTLRYTTPLLPPVIPADTIDIHTYEAD